MKNAYAVRWGDNDRYLGPFTWSISSYKPWAIVLKSRGDDDDESGKCSLRISLRSLTLIVALPNIIKPYTEKVYPGSAWDAAIGHSIEMLPGELHEAAFKRYCAEHEMTFGPRL